MRYHQRLEQHIVHGLQAAFLDGTVMADEKYEPGLVTNNYREGKKVSSVIEKELNACETYVISVAFITWAGLAPLLESFKELRAKGIRGRLLTTDYQMFSEPKALRFLKEQAGLEVRMYRTDHDANGFHTKGYIFAHGEYYTMIVGSSNLTVKAMSTNQEWNVRVLSTKEGDFARQTLQEFESLWNSEASEDFDTFIDAYTAEYEENRRVRTYIRKIEEGREPKEIQPNAMQRQFLENLKEMQKEGKRRALLISATGTGKTYASALAVRQMNPGRMLFLVHREQIARKAMESYQRILGGRKEEYGVLSGSSHSHDVKYLFATVETMTREEVCTSFARNAFDVIVVDEAHHAASASYLRLMDYFTPKFWLGMTGSPDRMDSYDVYELFDNNIACEIRLQQALEENMLCPFHYFGITDRTEDDTSEVYDNSDRSLEALTSETRVNNIVQNARFFGYSGKRVKGLIFCSRKDEGRKLSEKMNARGLRTVFLSGDDSQAYREECVERLSEDEGLDYLEYLITVDIFNEGIDIPEVNQVIFLRPTQSPVVFIQQMGRGLRKTDDKEFVVILDFIGNYTNNYMIPIALSGDRSYSRDTMRRMAFEGSRSLPGPSTIHFDAISRERIYQSISQSKVTSSFRKEKYFALKAKLNRIPTIMDFYTYGELDPRLFITRTAPSYDAFVRKYDGDYQITYTKHQETILAYVTDLLLNGMRPHELVMLGMIMNHESLKEETFEQKLKQIYPSVIYRKQDYDSAIRILQNAFISTPQDRLRYGNTCILNERKEVSPAFAMDLLDGNFRQELHILMQYGMKQFEDRYAEQLDENNLALYEKYSRRDVCRLLDWPKDQSSTIFGYRIAYNTCPIFVTYQKMENITAETRYEDRFLSNDLFSWMTRHNVRREDQQVKDIMHARENGMKILLFIKKNDAEGSGHYYLGEVTPAEAPVQKEITKENGKREPIVNIIFRLKKSVRDDLYDYLTE